MLCQFLSYSKENGLYIYVSIHTHTHTPLYPLFFEFLSHLGHCRALSRVPCAHQLSVLRIVSVVVYVSIQTSEVIPPHLFPTLVSVCSLRLCLYFCFANKIVCTTFLDSMSMLIYNTCFLLTDFTLYDSLWVHIPTHVCIEYFLALHLHFIDTFKMHADFKGKTQVFSQLVFCLL